MKYELIIEHFYKEGTLDVYNVEAKDDVEAIIISCGEAGSSYYDDEDREYGEEGFVKPSLKEALKHLKSINGDEFHIYILRNLDNGKIIFRDYCDINDLTISDLY